MTHPRINELPESYRHPRHFWVFDLPEQETQIWLGRFQLDHDFRRRQATEGPVIQSRHIAS